jgi:hypothetical protein
MGPMGCSLAECTVSGILETVLSDIPLTHFVLLRLGPRFLEKPPVP